MLNIREENWYGYNHAAMRSMLSDGEGVAYVRTFSLKGEGDPVAVYRSANPDLSKGHKEFILIQTIVNPITEKSQGLIRGMDADEIAQHAVQDAIECGACGQTIYSINRHHMCYCSCGAVAIDGGKDYTKVSTTSTSASRTFTINLITGLEVL